MYVYMYTTPSIQLQVLCFAIIRYTIFIDKNISDYKYYKY